MGERLKIGIPIVVEGKYDKITLSQVIDGNIFTTDGFGIFNSKEKQALLRRLAGERGLILLTDSDGGGKQIRSFLQGILPKDKLIQLYIPRIEGKERRKHTPSKSGTLGVEGMERKLLYELFLPLVDGGTSRPSAQLEKRDFYNTGLSGGADSAKRRARLSECLSLPADMTANALLEAVNLLCTREEFDEAIQKIIEEI